MKRLRGSGFAQVRPIARLMIGAAFFGFVYSLVFVRYQQTIIAHSRWGAAYTDFLLGMLGVGSLHAWEASGRKMSVLVSEVVGMSLGSYLAT